VRTKSARPGEDHVEIDFADRDKIEKLVVFPGDSQARVPRKLFWQGGRRTKDVQVADSLQPKGWAVELRLPLAAVPGWAPGVPAIKLSVGAFDSDSKSHPAIETSLSTSPLDAAAHLGNTSFAEASAALQAFLRDRHLAAKD